MDNLQLSLNLDIKPFVEGLKNSGKFSKEAVAEIERIFNGSTLSDGTPFRIIRKEAEEAGAAAKQSVEEVTYLTESELAKAEAAYDEMWDNARQNFKNIENTGGVTLQSLIDKLNELKEELLITEMGTPEFEALAGQIRVVEDRLENTRKEVKGYDNEVDLAAARTGAFRTSLSQSVYVLGQLDPRIGGVVQALQPMIYGMDRGAVKGQGWKAVLAGIGGQLIGPMGLGIAIAGVTAFIQHFISEGDKAEKEMEEMKGKAKELRGELQSLSKDMLQLALSNNLAAQSSLVNQIIKDGGEITAEQDKQLTLYKMQELAIKEQIKAVGDLNNLENERRELQEKIKGLKNLDASQGPVSPRSLALYNQYSERLKEINKILDQYSEKEKKKKQDNLITTQQQIREQIKLIDTELKAEKDPINRLKLIDLRNEKLRELVKTIRDLAGAWEQMMKKNLPAEKTLKEIFDPFFQPIGTPPKPVHIKETTAELERQLFFSEMLTDSFNSAAQAAASAGASGVYAFRNANSVVQIFINSLIQAIAQALILKAVNIGLGFLGGAVPFLSFLIPGKDSGGLFRGRPGVDKNIVRLSDMEYVVNARATQQWLPLLEAINNNKLRGFNNGGLNTPGNYSTGFRLNDQVVQLNIKLQGKEEWSARKLKRLIDQEVSFSKVFK